MSGDGRAPTLRGGRQEDGGRFFRPPSDDGRSESTAGERRGFFNRFSRNNTAGGSSAGGSLSQSPSEGARSENAAGRGGLGFFRGLFGRRNERGTATTQVQPDTRFGRGVLIDDDAPPRPTARHASPRLEDRPGVPRAPGPMPSSSTRSSARSSSTQPPAKPTAPKPVRWWRRRPTRPTGPKPHPLVRRGGGGGRS